MMSGSETNKLMASSLTHQANGETPKIDFNRQLVAINNFLWRADVLMCLRNHEGALKMLEKAARTVGRMEEPDEAHRSQADAIKREVRIRQRLMSDRERFMPLILREQQPGLPFGEFRLKVIEAPTTPRFVDELECILHVRDEVFHELLGVPLNIERDERDETARHLVLYLGDAIVACARIWAQDHATHVLDRILVIPEYRGRGLASRLFSVAAEETRAKANTRLLVLLRNDPPDSESQRIRTRLREKLIETGAFKVSDTNLFLPHAGVAGQLGVGVHATLLECLA